MMKNRKLKFWSILWGFLFIGINFTCSEQEPKVAIENIPENIEVTVSQVFLADAIPLSLSFDIRWLITDTLIFDQQFDSPKSYNEWVLVPRTKELCNQITAAYRIKDFKQSQKIQQFKEDIASALLHHLSETGTLVEEIQVTNIQFPKRFARLNQKIQAPLKTLSPPPQDINELIVSQQERIKLQLSTLQMLVKAEKIAGEKFVLNSGYRNRVHNRMVNGVPNSAHLRGLAIDIAFKGRNQKKQILNALKKAGFKRIGVYYNHIHADNDHSLPTPSRW